MRIPLLMMIYTGKEINALGELGYLKFVGDSLYLISSSFLNGEVTTFEFAGKRH